MKRFLLALSFSLVTWIPTTYAQDNAADVESLKSFVRDIYEVYVSNESKDLNSEKFKGFFDRQFIGSEVQVDLTGKVRAEQDNLETLLKDFNRYRLSDAVDAKFKVKQFNSTQVKGKTGVVIMDLDFELVKNGEVISRGNQSVSLTARKYQNTWKVTFMNRVFVQSEVYMGNCYCDLFSRGEDDFATFLTMPDGDAYVTATDQFKVAVSGSRRVIKMNGEDWYEWDPQTGAITKGNKKVGSARAATTAIKMILQSVNSEKCQKVVSSN